MVMSCCLSLVPRETNHMIKSRRRFPRSFWLSLAATGVRLVVETNQIPLF